MVKLLNCIVLAISASAAALPVVNLELPGGIFQGEVSFQGTQRPVAAFRGIPYAAPPIEDLRWRPPEPPKPWRPRILRSSYSPGCVQVKHDTPRGRAVGAEDCLVLNLFAPHPINASARLPVLFWVHGGGYQVGSGSGVDTDGSYDVGNLGAPMIIVAINYRLNVFGFAASGALRDRDPLGGTGNYGILDQRMAMQWVRDNVHIFGGDPGRVFISGQSAGGDAVGEHLVRERSWGLFHAAGLESGAFYQMSPPTPADVPKMPCKGPSPGNVTVEQQEGRWEEMMRKLKCKDVACAINASASDLLVKGTVIGPSLEDCGWVPAIDGVDLNEPSILRAKAGLIAPVTVVAGSTMEDGFIVPVNCPDPGSCTESDFRRWASSGYGLNASDVDLVTKIYSDEQPRPNLTVGSNGTKWYWAQVHAGADVQSTCPARRLARWVTQAGYNAHWYYWTYPPKDPLTGASLPAAHCSELKFLWGLRCNATWTAGKPWAVEQCQFGLQFAAFWQAFAATNTSSRGPIGWPSYGDGGLVQDGGNALLVNNTMHFQAVKHLRQSRCDFWDDYFEIHDVQPQKKLVH